MKPQIAKPLLAVALALAAGAAMALPMPRTENNVTVLTGGVGEEEQAAMKAAARDYNLRMMFALRAGNYLADVKVTILDARGQPVVDTVSDGPWLYAKLAPGTYTVIADNDGQRQTRKLRIAPSGDQHLAFYWPGNA